MLLAKDADADQVHTIYRRTVGHVAFELFGIVAAGVSVALLVGRAGAAIAEAEADVARVLSAIAAAAVVAGYVLADFASGVVHFTFDRFFTLDTPLLGKHFVAPFRQHHSDPKHITKHGFIETNGNNCLATCPALFALVVLPFDYSLGWQLFFVIFVVAGAVGTFATNQFHKWAHHNNPPTVVAWLQAHRVILPRDHHQIHHSHPYDTHYCITTGWLNPLLLKLNFWKGLEFVGTKVLRQRMFTETTPWEQVPGSPAFEERTQMRAVFGPVGSDLA
jgi:ubiquitin-conjugating enzyme E2 variant